MSSLPMRQLALTLIVFLAVSPFAAYAAPAMVGADESYIVLTGSMEPGLVPGDVVFVSSVPAAQIGVGDVVTFERGEGPPTTHRVIEVVTANGDRTFRTQGDNNEDPDPVPVRSEQVVGVVTFSIPYVGTVITAADSQYGFVGLVVLPFALLVLDVSYGKLRARRGAASAAGQETDTLPVLYDQAEAARVYYERADAALREAEATAGGFSGRDMTAAIAVGLVLVGYAAWNAYWQMTALGQPRPETMSVFSGALVGLVFLIYLRVTGTDSSETPGATAATPTPATRDRNHGAAESTDLFVPAVPRTVAEEEVHDAD
jgi:signal peptidase